MPITSRAAIVREAPGEFEIAEVEVGDPRQNEIRVRMVAAGMCHSDYHMMTGDSVAGHLPMVCGHEGTGIVESVGPNTPGWEVGDAVVFTWIPSCGKCRWCTTGMTNLCDRGRYLLAGHRFDDEESYRFALPDGTEVGQMCQVGSFSEYTLVSVDSAIKLPSDADLDKFWLLGCGVGTGWGSAVYAAETQPGDVVIVMGIGGIGINAVQGAHHAGAVAVIAVDPVEFKRESALRLGATHAFATMDEAADFARSITNWQGADRAIVAVGVVEGEHVAQAVSAIRKGGVAVITGIAPDRETSIPISPLELTRYQKRIQGTIYGHANPRADVPRQLQMYQAGQLKLDELITKMYTLDEINQGYLDMVEGRNIRGGIRF
ncbi:NDMA-dependent alcohol dehydrogenase [Microbacterium immunditiarum]|uniref:S-(Hydroxymethyl)glutathione dehydrogenase/alcohol dehydrogenase n=1 Tax=Microbacterium immunditiarum TaxID=337480 RepID=A0A7Y9GRD8_9MICO|nr:NDMA-dependent alcohol dehydrogenase [Microbacterium immunditiarum]NYE21117.1 S-(hydroxymethyl)glutathione dehydrogenase/alcohol dehydrogenase [Microbacterium immunditiarum]